MAKFSFRRSKFCKERRDKTVVPDPLVLEDLTSYKLNNIRKLARLIKQYKIYPYTVQSALLLIFAEFFFGVRWRHSK